MSDLAPFVAAVLRDKVIADQLEEVQELRQQLRRARRISIHGASRVLVEAQLEDGFAIDTTRWSVAFPKNSCPLNDLRLAEFQVGGVARAELYRSVSEAFVNEYDAKRRMEISAYYSPGLWVTFSVGPVEQEFYDGMADVDSEYTIEYVLANLARTPSVQLHWKSVEFTAGSAKGAVSDMMPRNADPGPQNAYT